MVQNDFTRQQLGLPLLAFIVPKEPSRMESGERIDVSRAMNNQNVRKFLWIVLSIALGVLTACDFPSRNRSALSAHVSCKVVLTNSSMVTIRFMNRSSKPLTIREYDTPFYIQERMTISLVVDNRSRTPIPIRPLPVHPPFMEVVLQPLESLEQNIDLNLYFPELAIHQKYSDILLLWAYRPPTNGPTKLGDFTGVLVLPKQ